MPVNTARLSEYESLRRGQQLVNGDFAFTLQDDGNMCLTFRGNYLWGTSTHDKDCQSASMQPDGNLALRNGNGDFLWGSMQSGGNMKTGARPYLYLHDNGNLGIYSSGDTVDSRIWTTNTGAIRFRAVNFINDGRNVATYPLLKRPDGSTILDGKTLTDGRTEQDYDEDKSFHMESSKNIGVDFNTADFHHCTKDHSYHEADLSCLKEVGHFRDYAHGLLKLGHSVNWGDDVWVGDQVFLYDPSSSGTVHIRKYGGQRDGDAAFDGTSTERWFDSNPGWSRMTSTGTPAK